MMECDCRAHKEGVANVCWPHVSWEIVYSRFVVHYHGDHDHGSGCGKMVMLRIVTMMKMTMMVIILSVMGCGEQGCW